MVEAADATSVAAAGRDDEVDGLMEALSVTSFRTLEGDWRWGGGLEEAAKLRFVKRSLVGNTVLIKSGIFN
jgi:hypothetical protein